MKQLFFDAFSGVAGDMALSALVDLGADARLLEQQLQKVLPEHPLHLHFAETTRKGARGLHLQVHLPHEHHHHRGLPEIIQRIEAARLSPYATNSAIAVFDLVAEAEARIHHCSKEEVHFHEVGALDSILDIVGVCLALDQLKPEKILASPIALGFGLVDCAHGSYPVPALATLELLQGVPLRASQEPFELTTPTGAALIKVLVEEFSESIPAGQISRIGYGAGTRELTKQPNLLRALWLED